MKDEVFAKYGKKELVLMSLMLFLVLAISGIVFALDYDGVEEGYFTNATVVGAEEVENLTAGIDAGSNLHFGEISEGTNVTKTLNLNSPRKSLVEVDSDGNISRNLEYEEYSTFEGNHSVDVMMVGSEPGYFEGNVTLDIEVANNGVTSRWLELKNWFYSR